jgi:hypothetical protein
MEDTHRQHGDRISLLSLFENKESRLIIPLDGVSTLSWWWGLSAPETLRAMPAVV